VATPAGEATLWERVDEPVLRWVFSLPPSLVAELENLEEREPVPFPHIPGLHSLEVNESLYRLVSFGLVDGLDARAMANTTWSLLRVTARGLVALGEWPDLDRVVSAASLTTFLRRLAEEAPEDHRGALERTAGVLSRTADDVLKSTATDLAKTIGKEAAGA
jgi:hypothetical protein